MKRLSRYLFICLFAICASCASAPLAPPPQLQSFNRLMDAFHGYTDARFKRDGGPHFLVLGQNVSRTASYISMCQQSVQARGAPTEEIVMEELSRGLISVFNPNFQLASSLGEARLRASQHAEAQIYTVDLGVSGACSSNQWGWFTMDFSIFVASPSTKTRCSFEASVDFRDAYRRGGVSNARLLVHDRQFSSWIDGYMSLAREAFILECQF